MKEWWKSRMFWLNLVVLLLAVIEGLGWELPEPTKITNALAVIIVALINLILRWRTTEGIALHVKKE